MECDLGPQQSAPKRHSRARMGPTQDRRPAPARYTAARGGTVTGCGATSPGPQTRSHGGQQLVAGERAMGARASGRATSTPGMGPSAPIAPPAYAWRSGTSPGGTHAPPLGHGYAVPCRA